MDECVEKGGTMLETERKFLESNREALLKEYGGKFLVISGEEVGGAFDTIEEAIQGAVAKYGLANVLIRRPGDTQMELSAPALTLGILNANPPQPGSVTN
ncbi:MAG: hypothetical protein LAP13_15210 [Acidobacteriia bacterium]|nr:hypothetical protein [Terriglobia bacterium]